MSSIKEGLMTNWHLMRIVRLALGVWMAGWGVQAHDWGMGLFGAFFLYQAIANTGCCGTAACAPPRRRTFTNKEDVKEIEYEEVK